jgi:uroporphyrin-III C-methyltransferase
MNGEGKVYLIGAGPGDPELLTVKAARILGTADIVLHDALVSAEILATLPSTTRRVDVGKRCGAKLLTQQDINALMIAYARSAKIIVRLKGGDPGIFGRAGEEMDALLSAGIDFEVVPGVTAAIAAAAAVRISLTDRRIASSLLITTLQRRGGEPRLGIHHVPPNTTVAIYMPGSDYDFIARALCEAGIADDVPCALVASAFAKTQQVLVTTVGELAALPSLPAPTLLIAGHVVRANNFFADVDAWRDHITADITKAQVSLSSM